MNQTRKLHPAVTALIVIVLVGIVASAAIVIANAKDDDTVGTTTASGSSNASSTNSSTPASSTDTATYKDGTYNATGSYLSPNGRESIKLIVTIKDGIITDTSVENNGTDRETQQYQSQFANNYKTLVVGKKIGDVSLSRVAGSSLTSNGFNNALDQIKTDAKA
jgi:uncharacterized protein with FMN-binding domain